LTPVTDRVRRDKGVNSKLLEVVLEEKRKEKRNNKRVD
jgi:hypothetical protein